MSSIVTRRQTIVGVSATAAVGINGSAKAFSPWWIAFSATLAAGWLVEALKNWGLVPQTNTITAVHPTHEQAALPLQQEGYDVRPMYSGTYSGGNFELSEATRGNDFLALSTTSHWNNTCTHKFDAADAAALGLVSNALRQKGFDTNGVQASTLPIHPPGANRFVDDRRYSPTYMTPSHGMISWSTDASATRPNLETSIQSAVINARLRFAQLDNGRWVFDLQNA